ncbi:ABC transporter ATP-binding protein [Sphingobacterium faecale]|uniref:ABC transporter ATP-binding protein n=1 Tax=Sphingobacterium faecale TaxID=2803775 RepID=A0ABS1RBI2_9SPHI|nr:ABC transporter ATP-binding protein [Sphingobacterium faecale]MBL1411206.1 ABC transporter ATP-binding protein [Sphingobacterium faecale]
MSILITENLSHKYGAGWAIRDINIDIPQKGAYGLLGANGAGKSTLMNIICGALKPTDGRVIVNGIDLRKEPQRAKTSIGFLPQILPLYLDLSVEEYLRYTASLRLVDKKNIDRAVEEVLERCQITHFRRRLLKNLSGGYRQRVGIAQAIIHKPLLVVMDEPTNGLDPNQLIETRRLIQEVAEQSLVLLSSHILTEIGQLCQEIILIDKGELLFSDSASAFQQQVQSTYLQVIFDNPPPIEQLSQLVGVNAVDMESKGSYRISYDNLDMLTQQLLELSIQKGWKLKTIRPVENSMDEVFKELTNKR